MSISRFFVKRTPDVIELVDSDEQSDEEEEHTESKVYALSKGSKRQTVTITEYTESTHKSSESAEHQDQARISEQCKEESGAQTTSKSAKSSAVNSRDKAMETATTNNPSSVSLMTDDAGSTNPFAKFAFQQKDGSSSPGKQSRLDSWFNKPPAPKKPRTFSAGGKDWIRVQDLSVHEQERIITKWHSLVMASCSLEDARFQILVAARLHARCQEGPVRQAMKALNEQCTISVQQLAQMDPQELHPAICNLQYYPTKAKHLVKAAQEIQSQFGGKVPEQESQLRQLTGIGPVLADLLAFVNTRRVHEKRQAQPCA